MLDTSQTYFEKAARIALVDAREGLDISAADCEPDRAAWEKMSAELTQLLFQAYIRNHTVDPD
jgi:hypothetical protein